MEVCNNGRRLHLPSEIVEIICKYFVNQPATLCTLRLVCRAFHLSTTPLLQQPWNSPSEHFTAPDTDSILQQDTEANPKCITIWTEVDLGDIQLDQDAALRFREIFYRPDEVEHNPNIPKASQGRKAICWGHERESNILWLVLQYDNEASFEAFRQSENGRNLGVFLDSITPGCVATSKSERLEWPLREKSRRPLFSGYAEVRTIYFTGSMTLDQRLKFEKAAHGLCSSLNNASNNAELGSKEWLMSWAQSPLPDSWGATGWCWMSGLRPYRGKLAVAARFVIDWRDRIAEERHHAALTGGLENVMEGLVKDGPELLGVESEHCNFSHGPWRN